MANSSSEFLYFYGIFSLVMLEYGYKITGGADDGI